MNEQASRKRRWLAVAAVVALAAAGVAWWQWQDGSAARALPSARVPPTVTTAEPAIASTGAPDRPVAHLAVASTATDGRGESSGPWCGPARDPADPTPDYLAQAASLPRPDTSEQVRRTLKSGATPEAQAFGAWLDAFDPQQRAEADWARRFGACGDDEPCRIRMAGEADRQRATHERQVSDHLAELARDTQRPALYAMAVEACHPRGTSDMEGPCRLITHERWAQLDPGNAVPWLHLAGLAAQRKDAAGVAEALHRASLATRSEYAASALAGLAEPALAGLPDIERTKMRWQMLDLQTRWQLPDYTVLGVHCAEGALRDGNRQQTCNALATMLLDHGRTMIERSTAVRLAERLRWPAERVAALRQEHDAMVEAMAMTLPMQKPTPPSCARWIAETNAMGAMLRDGEVNYARAAIRRSGLGTAELAERSAVRRAAIIAKQAASAASVASPARIAPGSR